MEASVDTSRAAAAQRIQQQLEAPEPVSWVPRGDEGHPQQLIGELVGMTGSTTAYGPKKIAILRDLEGRLWNVWLMHHTLEQEFLMQEPQQGEMLGISYLGHVDTGDGPGYEKYRLVVERNGHKIDWGAKPDDEPPPDELPPAAQVEATQAPVQPVPPCPACGFLNGNHQQGCPEDIPF